MGVVHVIGTGTIGEPLIGLLADHRADFDIDEVTFHKRTPFESGRSQSSGFVSSPTVDHHDDARFGTHHALDAHGLFATLGHDMEVFSSAVKLNTQYMHAIHFSLTLDRRMGIDEVRERLAGNTRVAVTKKTSAGEVFSFGRDHGYFGRILSQTVVAVDTLAVRNDNTVVGFCFTPQDGNPLLSTVSAMLWFMDPATRERKLDALRPYLFNEV